MNSNGNTNRCKFLLFVYIICSTLFTISLFLSSFFPTNYHSNATATADDIPREINGIKLNVKTLYKPVAKKIVFMVIDALRWDFVNSIDKNMMPITNKLIDNRSACLLQLKANAPTVTMPRVKAMMTGTVSSFIDVALNFGKTSVTTDSFLHQAKYHGHSVIFYGDDTWLKLFPELFKRHEETTSFYVSDFTEVDENVTRNVNKELYAKDWSIMILHYLGLDHIGHSFGPSSHLVAPKLREMDGIVDDIFQRVKKWNDNGIPSLFIVCGDHGMKNSGGHGGATPEETLVPFIVFGNTCSCPRDRPCQADQVDVAASLSMLLGIPLPHLNLGSVAMSLFENSLESEKLFLLHYNAKHTFNHFRKLSDFESSEIYDNYYKVIKLHTEWLIGKKKEKSGEFEFIGDLYQRVLKEMKDILIRSAVKYDRTLMTVAIVLAFQILLIIACVNFNEPFTIKVFIYWWLMGISSWLLLNHSFHNDANEAYFEINNFTIITIVLLFFTINCYFCSKISKYSVINFENSHLIMTIAVISHVVSLASSSFIEEEHQTWYFFWTTYLIYLIYSDITSMCNSKKFNRENFMKIAELFFLLVAHRALRKLNSTGNKFAHLPDIAGWLRDQSNVGMSLVVGISLGLLILIGFLSEKGNSRKIPLIFHIILSICVYTRHASDGAVVNLLPFHQNSRGIHEVRIFWITLLLYLLYSFQKNLGISRSEKKFKGILFDAVKIFVIITVLLHRPHNIILVPMELITILVIYGSVKDKNKREITGIMYGIGNVFYFYQGNSNSLATIDVAAGYVGLQCYSPIIVTIYLCINTYSAPILSYLMILYKNTNDGNNLIDHLFSVNRFYSMMRIFPFAVYTVIVTAHRYHLFIWTVFSPKLLYESMYTVVLFFMMFIMQLPFILTDRLLVNWK